MTLGEMKDRKRELGLTNADIARLSCVPLSTVNKLFSGATKAPRRATLLAVESVLVSARGSGAYAGNFADGAEELRVTEAGPGYRAFGGSNEAGPAYRAFADSGEMRAELIDGVIYDMPELHYVHQLAAAQIGYQLMRYADENKCPFKILPAPVEVQIDRDGRTLMRPDIMILRDPESLLKNGRVFGAPDFVIEILSPETRRRDLTLKLAKYSAAGVGELWYVDPEGMKVITYDLEGDSLPVTHDFSEKVPIRVLDGKCSVDFARVYDDIREYLG